MGKPMPVDAVIFFCLKSIMYLTSFIVNMMPRATTPEYFLDEDRRVVKVKSLMSCNWRERLDVCVRCHPISSERQSSRLGVCCGRISRGHVRGRPTQEYLLF